MNYTIWKYSLAWVERQCIDMPIGAEILCVKIQNCVPCLWAKVNATAGVTENRIIFMYGTGHPMQYESGAYIDTVSLGNGLIFHFYDGGHND
jgi:hypothetical protein